MTDQPTEMLAEQIAHEYERDQLATLNASTQAGDDWTPEQLDTALCLDDKRIIRLRFAARVDLFSWLLHEGDQITNSTLAALTALDPYMTDHHTTVEQAVEQYRQNTTP
jgi:hypothetical protein